MGTAIDKAVDHYESLGLGHHCVEEWDNLAVYWRPLSLWEKRSIYPPDKTPDELAPADVLIRKALDRDLKPLFTVEDRERLMRKVDQWVVQRLAVLIMAPVRPDPDEQVRQAEKN